MNDRMIRRADCYPAILAGLCITCVHALLRDMLSYIAGLCLSWFDGVSGWPGKGHKEGQDERGGDPLGLLGSGHPGIHSGSSLASLEFHQTRVR